MSRFSSQFAVTCTALMAATLCGMTHAAEVRRMPLTEKVWSSDIVVIATADAVHRDETDNGVVRFANLQVIRVLKGKEELSTFEFVTHGSISESNPNCCEVGARYLIFAQKRRDGFYESTNGVYGSYLISEDKVSGWPLGSGETHALLRNVLEQICNAKKSQSPKSQDVAAPPSKPPTVIDEGD